MYTKLAGWGLKEFMNNYIYKYCVRIKKKHMKHVFQSSWITWVRLFDVDSHTSMIISVINVNISDSVYPN